MKSMTSILRYLAGTGLELVGRQFKLTDAYIAAISGAQQKSEKDQPLGYPGLGSTSEIYANLIPRYGTAIEINGINGILGEVGTTSDTHDLRIFDGATAGGHSATLNSKSTVVVNANGTETQNGQALINAYNIAKLLQPNGLALAANNRATVFAMPGVYSLVGQAANWTWDTSFVDVIGISGSINCHIIVQSTPTRQLAVGSLNKDHRFQGFTIRKDNPAGTPGQLWSISAAGAVPSKIYHRDLVWDMGTSASTINCHTISNFNTTTQSLDGDVIDCMTIGTGQQWYGGVTCLFKLSFVNCNCTLNKAFGAPFSDTAVSAGVELQAPGKMVRCTYIPPAGRSGNRFNCLIFNCDLTMDIQKVGPTAGGSAGSFKISYSRIKGNGTNPPLNNDSAVSVPFCFCQFPAQAIGANITNSLGATPAAAFNIQDNDI